MHRGDVQIAAMRWLLFPKHLVCLQIPRREFRSFSAHAARNEMPSIVADEDGLDIRIVRPVRADERAGGCIPLLHGAVLTAAENELAVFGPRHRTNPPDMAFELVNDGLLLETDNQHGSRSHIVAGPRPNGEKLPVR